MKQGDSAEAKRKRETREGEQAEKVKTKAKVEYNFDERILEDDCKDISSLERRSMKGIE